MLRSPRAMKRKRAFDGHRSALGRTFAALALLSSSCCIIAGLEDKEPRQGGSKGSGGTSGGDAGADGTSGHAGIGEGGLGGDASGGSASGRGGGGATTSTGGGGGSGQGGAGGSAGTGGRPTDCDETLPRYVETTLAVGPDCVRVARTTVRGMGALVVAPGTTLLMESGAYLDTESNGVLQAVGTASEPIVFTSSATEPAPGDWQCVRLDGSRSTSEVRHVTFEYGGTCENDDGMLQLMSPARAVSDSVFRHALTHGVRIERDGEVAEFQNNAFASNGAASIHIAAPQVIALGPGLRFESDADRIEVNAFLLSLTTSGTWLGQPVPFRVSGQLALGAIELTIAAGTTIEFIGSSMLLPAGSALIVAGTEAAPVTFTSGFTPQAPGDWGCIEVSNYATASLDHAVLEYAGNGTLCTGANIRTAIRVGDDASITNSTFRNIAGSAIDADDCDVAGWCENVFESVETGPLVCGSGTNEMPTACP
jgi:hypothetical protein